MYTYLYMLNIEGKVEKFHKIEWKDNILSIGHKYTMTRFHYVHFITNYFMDEI